ncbi:MULTISPECIES: hypothetical protein [Bacillus]|uniref:hypothetical protein n=1 Tax=Bacillus TaxID=1386 RepID=UPI0007D05BE6|nr:hypothetical protein [Bacillus velezensis]OAL89152.1 hypothetical protein AY609_19170 [Bacillus velezensis]
MNKEEKIQQVVTIPSHYRLVEKRTETRNGNNVTILRYQKNGKFILNGPRIIAVFEGDEMISLKNLSVVPEGKFLSTDRAKEMAEGIFSKIKPSYAMGLSFIRIDNQQRQFIDENGKVNQFPIQWIKFGHSNGSYNWVTLGANGSIIEMEIDSHWDYFRGRRKTEMWDNDDWVLAREGKGPQLPIPNALA